MSKIESNSKRLAIASAVVLAAGLALQIAAIYVRSVSASHLMTTIGKVGTFVGATGLSIGLPIYLLKRGENDPNIYKKLIGASLIAVLAGAILMGVNTGHPASKMLGQSLLNISGGIFVTILFYAMIYGRETESSAAAPQAVSHSRQEPRGGQHRTFSEKGRAEEVNDPHGVQAAKARRIEVNQLQKATHQSIRIALFGNKYCESKTIVIASRPPDEKIFESEQGNENVLFLSYHDTPYTLAKNEKGHVLRLIGHHNVQADIWDTVSWKTKKNWLLQDDEIKAFNFTMQAEMGEEETEM